MTSEQDPQSGAEPACYRHTDRPSGVRCQRCERFICASCMNQASVGVHCPECVKGNSQKVYTRATVPGERGVATQVLIGLNLFVFGLQFVLFDATISSDGSTAQELATSGRAVDVFGEWWRVFTSGFGHFGIFHLGMNMYSLFILGQLIERRLGPRSYTLAYTAALIGGSCGALLVEPNSLSMGASGAIFGLLGLLVMLYRSHGISIAQSGLGPVLLINLLISLSGFVSLGGHAGGFITGLLLGVVYFGADAHAGPMFGRDRTKADIATVVVGGALFVGALVAARTWSSPLL